MTTQSNIDKRAKILDAALHLFVEKGFHATPTSAISTAAGVSAGILFHYFKTKEELIYTLFLETKLELYRVMMTGLDKVKSPEGKFRLIWSNVWNYGVDQPHKFKFVQQIHNSPFEEKIKEDHAILDMTAQMTQSIQAAIDTGILKDAPIELHMNNFYFLILGLVELIWQKPELRNDNTFVEQAWESFWDCHKA